jgi:hypothetical protein
MRYTIDLDIFKMIAECHKAREIKWRVSSSRKGFHILWECHKTRCSCCARIEKKFDDPKRRAKDAKREKINRKVLWDFKGGCKSGPWIRVKIYRKVS